MIFQQSIIRLRTTVNQTVVLLMVAAAIWLAASIQPQHAVAQQRNASPKGPPELSLASLYQPQQKFDFDGELPATHWINDLSSQLLIRREDTWNVVDLATKNESPWPVVDQLRQRLSGLDGISEEQAKSAARAAVLDMKRSGDTVLAQIDKSLAIVSIDGPVRWLTRDATAWCDSTLDPTARRVAYTRDGDLFLVDVRSGKQSQLTTDGSETLLDGLLDWTYQEEIYGRGNFRGFWFSPDGNWLAMLRIDISGIEPFTLSSAASTRGKGIVSRYPKAGDPIPHATLLVWDLRPLDSDQLPLSRVLAQSSPQQERIITGVWWHPHDGSLLCCLSDRKQTWRELRRIEAEALAGGEHETKVLLREESPAWVEPPAAPQWLEDGGLIWRSELPTGRMRLYHVTLGGQFVTPLTPDGFDVRDFWLVPQSEFLVVTGDAQRGSVGQQVYRVAAKPTVTDRKLDALTIATGWHTAAVSPDGKWFVDQYSSASQPASLSVVSTEGSNRIDLVDGNLSVPGKLIEPLFFPITTPDGISLPAMLVKPESNPARGTPVVIEVYGGPQAPMVVDRWSGTRSLYRQLLARRGIATLVADNRSSAGRGLADTWSIQGRVGEIEFDDLMVAVTWLQSQNWVDKERLAIRGWSFGGFLTLYAMTHSDVFAAGIAGGSVTDWSEYDAFYTERYMGLPSENSEGYQSTAPVHAAENLSGVVLMIHGEADDNVHPSETLRMAKALQDAGKDFQLMIYPGEAHAVHQPTQLWHLSKMTDQFLQENLVRKDRSGAAGRGK